MEILVSVILIFTTELLRHIAKDCWKLIKKRIKKPTFTPSKRRKGGETIK